MSDATAVVAKPDAEQSAGAAEGGDKQVAVVPPQRANPFRSVALLMQSVNDSLEAANSPGAARRWVRIVRVREFLQGDNKGIIAQGVDKGVTAFIEGISYIQRFTLLAYDLLRQGDAVKALFEVSLDFIDTVADPEFINSITAVVDGPEVSTANNPLAAVKTGTDLVRKYKDKVPEPEDLDLIGQQLYRMLAIVQLPPEAKDADLTAATAHIDMQLTGKLRLLQWGLAHPYNVREVVKGKDVGVSCLGTRRLWKTADLAQQPQRSVGLWNDPNVRATDAEGKAVIQVETMFEFNFADAAMKSKDLDEARSILSTLGYTAGTAGSGFDDVLSTALQQFQLINGLTQTGKIDNPTINRMMHLNYNVNPALGGLKRAKPFDARNANLANFNPVT